MNRLIDSKNNYTTKYAGLVMEDDRLRARQENLLTALVKEAQTSEEEGIDIKEMGIKVDLDGYEGHLVYAIRTVSEEGYSDCLELKVTTTGYESDIEWLSIYDFYSDTAIKVLSEIMENL